MSHSDTCFKLHTNRHDVWLYKLFHLWSLFKRSVLIILFQCKQPGYLLLIFPHSQIIKMLSGVKLHPLSSWSCSCKIKTFIITSVIIFLVSQSYPCALPFSTWLWTKWYFTSMLWIIACNRGDVHRESTKK